MPLDIPPPLQEKLRSIRAKQQRDKEFVDEVFDNNEVVILTLGMGPAMYLGTDGRVIVWDGAGLWLKNTAPHETTDPKEIVGGIVIGAKRLGLAELLELLPPMPQTAATCSQCGGKRIAHLQPASGDDKWIVCFKCGGLGWID